MTKNFILILILIVPLLGQELDSLNQKSTKKAAQRALMFPGGGQFYNGQPIKGALLMLATVTFGFMSMDYGNKYKIFDGVNTTEKTRYLKLRNKYGWWVGFIYIYGLIDAIVEAHLQPFHDVMNEDLEQPKEEEEQKQ